MNELEVEVGQYSDAGKKAENEDCHGIRLPDSNLLRNKGVVAAIADGISSTEFGREASEACVTGFIGDYYSTPDSWSVKESARQVLIALNSWLHGRGLHHGSARFGALTTFSALVLKSTTAHLIHIGDTRIYRIREGEIELLTSDHRTWIGNEKHYLSRAVGADNHLEIDYRRVAAQQDDLYLLTTDGVHDCLSEERLAALVAGQRNLETAAREIVAEALAAGSTDNLTCQLVRIRRLPSGDPDEVFRALTELPFPPELSAGRIIDGYRILRELHLSKRSELYLALDPDTGLQVVIKTPSVNYEDDPAYIERFTLEEWIGKRINNPHVVQVYEASRPRHFLYHITEFIEGGSLRQWLQDNDNPSLSQVRDIVGQIARGVQSFHRMDMVHQDLKPENIVVDQHGTAKIIDFGSVRVAGIAEIETPVERSNLLGTRNYTAPEYALDQPGSNHSDIFSLAVICYELLTHRLPYGEMPENWTRVNPLAGKSYTPARAINDQVPDWLDAALEKALHPDPKQRYSQLSEFIHDINHPNPMLSGSEFKPLVQRYPIGFWRALSALLGSLCLLLLYLLLR